MNVQVREPFVFPRARSLSSAQKVRKKFRLDVPKERHILDACRQIALMQWLLYRTQVCSQRDLSLAIRDNQDKLKVSFGRIGMDKRPLWRIFYIILFAKSFDISFLPDDAQFEMVCV